MLKYLLEEDKIYFEEDYVCLRCGRLRVWTLLLPKGQHTKRQRDK